MALTREIPQVKHLTDELVAMFRQLAFDKLLTDGIITQEEAAEWADCNVLWRGAPDGGIIVTLDPPWKIEA